MTYRVDKYSVFCVLCGKFVQVCVPQDSGRYNVIPHLILLLYEHEGIISDTVCDG